MTLEMWQTLTWLHEAPVPIGQTVNSGFYNEVLRRLLKNLQRRRPELWREQTWLLYHDNVPSHTSVLAQQFLEKYKMVVIPHTPYSPDLTPCDFFLLPKINLKLK
jgi:histone-lysine N-methyltransferase SETMAR